MEENKIKLDHKCINEIVDELHSKAGQRELFDRAVEKQSVGRWQAELVLNQYRIAASNLLNDNEFVPKYSAEHIACALFGIENALYSILSNVKIGINLGECFDQ